MEEKSVVQVQFIETKIYEVRGQKVMFDFDLAQIYEVETRVLKQAVRRNIELFPPDFMFELTKEEWKLLTSQFVIFETGQGKGKYPKFLSYVFNEHGVTMLANVLKSKKARLMSVTVVRAFIKLKEFALNYKELSDKLRQLETRYDQQFTDITEAINYLLQKDTIEIEQKERRRIGFNNQD